MNKACNRLAALAVAALAAAALPAAAHELEYTAALNGPNESPPQASPGTGFADVIIDLDLATMEVKVTFSGLLGNTTASHIHCCTAAPGTGTAGVATAVPTFPDFPLGVMSGTYDRTFDLTDASTYNPTFITNNGGTVGSAMNALLAGMAGGQAYLNIHSEFAPGGEIRGFLAPVPEPQTWALMGVGLAGLAGLSRRRAES